MLDDLHIPEIDKKIIEPNYFLERHFLERRQAICEWLEKQWELTSPPVYGSVDLRNSGFKIAPIDMNLFPAGFNNLNPDFLSFSSQAAKKIILQKNPSTKRILIVPESHTRNIFYWENIRTLQNILENADFIVQFGSLSKDITTPEIIDLPSGQQVKIFPLKRKNDKLYVEDFCPDVVLLNNDLSDGIPEILQHLAHVLLPPAELGWSHRLKSGHFQYYAQVAREFAEAFDIDPWLIDPLFRHCGKVNFMQQDGLDCLIANAETLFAEMKQKYAQYHIQQEPFLIVKADAGTYGMAVMTVRHVDELKTMNRKQRTRMSMTKGGQPVERVIIQEGVYTFETMDDGAVAEPVVYLWGDTVVGGFYRVHQDRGVDENLNAPGMRFEPIAFNTPCDTPCEKSDPSACQNRYFVYGIVARLSMLAAAREIKDQSSK